MYTDNREHMSGELIKICVICKSSFQPKSPRRLTCSRDCHLNLVSLRSHKQKHLGLKVSRINDFTNNSELKF